jgi:hypothetical protein
VNARRKEFCYWIVKTDFTFSHHVSENRVREHLGDRANLEDSISVERNAGQSRDAGSVNFRRLALVERHDDKTHRPLACDPVGKNRVDR